MTVLITLPSGLVISPPSTPRTWVDESGSTYGDELSAKYLESEVAAAVAFHRMRPFFQGEATVTTSCTASAYTPIPLAEMVDNVQGHSDTGNQSRWLTGGLRQAPHWYLGIGQIPYGTTDPTKSYRASLRVNGSTVFDGMTVAGATGHNVTPLVCDLVSLTGGDYLELCGWQDTAAAVSTTISSKTPTMSVRWAGSSVGNTVALPATPRTWLAADAITADLAGAGQVPLNVHIRDVLRYLNYPPIARITSQGSSQTIPTGTGTWTSIQMPTATVDNYTGWSSGANTRYTVQRAGLYFVYGLTAVAEASGAAGYRAARLLVNGTTVAAADSTQVATASNAGTYLPVFGHLRLAVNDFVELQMQQNDVGALTVKTGGTNSSRLIAVWRSL